MSSNDLIIGKEYVYLTINSFGKNSKGRATANCTCMCGKAVTALQYNIKNGNTNSCGCYALERRSENGKKRKTHGHSNSGPGGKPSQTYVAWASMLSRCYNPNDISYSNYGGRNITVCDQWRGEDGFANFLADFGELKKNETLDRFPNVNGNYEPDNVRAATWKEQQRNRRNNRVISHNGRSQTLAAWAEEYGLAFSQLYQRLAYGWDMERALTMPVQTWHSIPDILFRGRLQSLEAWAIELKIDSATLHYRLKARWSVERALTQPVNKYAARRKPVSGEASEATDNMAQ